MSTNGRAPDRGYITWHPIARIRAKLEAVQDVLATYHDHLPMTARCKLSREPSPDKP